MSKYDVLMQMQSKCVNHFDFNFDMLMAPPLASLVHPQDGWDIYEMAHSLKLASKLDYKLKNIDQIMKFRGFTKLGSGTNRVIYRYNEDNSILLKIAFDRTALSDNMGEFNNQQKLKPFIPKTFEVHPSGSIGLQERVKPITSAAEFMEYSDSIFDILVNNFIGQYILEDVGTKFFMNWGVRVGFGPVLLDYPYVYDLDGKKLYCNNIPMETGVHCSGLIEYNDGFNELYCTTCNKRYTARSLSKAIENKTVLVTGGLSMKVALMKGNKVILAPMAESDIIERPSFIKPNKSKEFRPTLTINGITYGDVRHDDDESDTIKDDRRSRFDNSVNDVINSTAGDNCHENDNEPESKSEVTTRQKSLPNFIDPDGEGEYGNIETTDVVPDDNDGERKSLKRDEKGRFISQY